MILEIQQCHLNLFKRETNKVYPIEACAILFGKYYENKVILQQVKITPNRLQSPTNFEIDPTTVVKAFSQAETEGLDFIGLFHSHPAPSVPSEIDLKFMKLWEGALWLIMSSTEDTIGAYMLEDAKVKKIPIVIN
ncbi:MAG: M67 family metallopeptidase [Candidatus Bathyarchaeota archaeon]